MQEIKFLKTIELWNDLGWYAWGGTYSRFMATSKQLDAIKAKSPFIYYITGFLSQFIII